jgi:hypothetical protein
VRGQRRRPAGAEEGVVGQLGGKLTDLIVEAVDSSAGGAELRKQDFDEQPVGLDGSRVGGQRQLFSDGRDAAIDGVLIADVVAPEERDEGFAPSTLSELMFPLAQRGGSLDWSRCCSSRGGRARLEQLACSLREGLIQVHRPLVLAITVTVQATALDGV